MCVEATKATLSENILIENGSRAQNESNGGGIAVMGGTVTISGNTLIGNEATENQTPYSPYAERGAGGGIFVLNAHATIVGNTLSKNKSLLGGGIYVEGTATITNNILSGNQYFENEGGGCIVSDGEVTITNNTITGNRSLGRRIGAIEIGAIIECSGSQKITGNLIANNVSEQTVVIYEGHPEFTGNVIIDNRAKYYLYYHDNKGSPNLNATNNYWGITNETELRVKIYDLFADSSKALVEIDPILADRPSLAVPTPSGKLKIQIDIVPIHPENPLVKTIITATLTDSEGNLIEDEKVLFVVSKDEGPINEVTNNHDGTYTGAYWHPSPNDQSIFVIVPNRRLIQSVDLVVFTRVEGEKPTKVFLAVPPDGRWHKTRWEYPAVRENISLRYTHALYKQQIHFASNPKDENTYKSFAIENVIYTDDVVFGPSNENEVGKEIWIRIEPIEIIPASQLRHLETEDRRKEGGGIVTSQAIKSGKALTFKIPISPNGWVSVWPIEEKNAIYLQWKYIDRVTGETVNGPFTSKERKPPSRTAYIKISHSGAAGAPSEFKFKLEWVK